jgi:hypothetical protein
MEKRRVERLPAATSRAGRNAEGVEEFSAKRRRRPGYGRGDLVAEAV